MSSSRKRTGVHSLLFQRELTGRRRTNLLLWSRELMYGSGRSASYIPLPETAKSTIALAFSADGEYFASTHGDHTVKVRPPLPQCPPNIGPHHTPEHAPRGRGDGHAGGRRRARALRRGGACHPPHARLRWPLRRGVKRRGAARVPVAAWSLPPLPGQVFRCATWTVECVLTGHERTPWTVKFHPHNNRLLASGSLDQTVRIWDVSTKQCLCRHHFDFVVSCIAFHSSGELLAVAAGKRILLWR